MGSREVKLETQLRDLIDRGGYTRNRGPILDSVGVTAAALSQYARGRTRPSFEKLVALADFFGVSLDYLVYGDPVSSPVDPGPIARFVEHALLDVQTRTNRHAELVTRIGRLLGDRIADVAKEIVESRSAGIEGLISHGEILRIERYCRNADIVATDLTANIIAVDRDEIVPGQFFQVVARNLSRGATYRFLLAGELTMQSPEIIRFREMMAKTVGDAFHANCSFRRTVLPIPGGYGVYSVDAAAFALEEPWLVTQFSKYLHEGTWFGYVNRPNADSQADMVMSSSYMGQARGTFEALWNAAAAGF